MSTTGGRSMEQSHEDDARAFARTFAPDHGRPPYRQSQLQSLGVGLVLVVSGLAILVTAWFAYQRAIPESTLRRAAGESFAAARDRNSHAAPFVALSGLPLLVAGGWLLAKRPDNDSVRLIALGAGAVFFVAGLLTAAFVG